MPNFALLYWLADYIGIFVFCERLGASMMRLKLMPIDELYSPRQTELERVQQHPKISIVHLPWSWRISLHTKLYLSVIGDSKHWSHSGLIMNGGLIGYLFVCGNRKPQRGQSDFNPDSRLFVENLDPNGWSVSIGRNEMACRYHVRVWQQLWASSLFIVWYPISRYYKSM